MQDIIIQIISNLFGYVFLISSISKLADIESHYAVIYSYEILPKNWTRSFTWIDSTSELLIGISLIIGFFVKITSFLFILLLGAYTLAITINLLKGRTEINCGCGGLVGNHKLSGKLLIRNIIFITIAAYITYVVPNKMLSFPIDVDYMIIQLIFVLLAIFVMTVQEVYRLKIILHSLNKE